MKLFQRHPRTQPSTPIRLNNHILEQIIINRVLLELARDAPQMTQRDRSVRAAREQLVRGVYFGGSGVVILGAELCGDSGDEGAVGDVAGGGWVDGGEDVGEFGGVCWWDAEGSARRVGLVS